ncbi:MAG TPA: hypothetical protein VFX55_10830 [Duganella sp.]|nr:hypothetical protein [Duganella sp.]
MIGWQIVARDVRTVLVGLQADHYRHAQENSAAMQRLVGRLWSKFAGGGKSRRGEASGQEPCVQVFFHEISLRIKELERRRSWTANQAAIRGLGNQRLSGMIKSCFATRCELIFFMKSITKKAVATGNSQVAGKRLYNSGF